MKLTEACGIVLRGVELSEAQLHVLRGMLLGLSNPQIASAASIKPRTVKFHVANILRKTGAKSRTALMARLISEADPIVIEGGNG